jgi:phosphatidate cytidylyltransferase
MLPPRVVTGAFYLVGWIAAAWLGGWPMTLVVAGLSVVALLELRWVAGRRRMRLAVEIGYPICIAFVFAAHWFANDPEGYSVALLALLTLLILIDFALHLGAGSRTPTAAVSLTAFGCVYCGLLMSVLVLIRGYQPDVTAPTWFGPLPLGARLLFFLLAVTMLSDVGAFVVGRGFGKHRLVNTVSPSKSVEGAVGGVVAAVLAALLAGAAFGVGATPVAGGSPAELVAASLKHRLILGLLLGTLGQVGDFGASIFKREAEVKDYGWLFPGHGGVLDRLDTLLINAPLLYLYVRLAL